MTKSPVAVIYGPNGKPAVWQTGANTTNDASRSMVLVGGLNANTALPVLLDPSGRQVMTRSAEENVLIQETFGGSIVNANAWISAVGSMTPSVANGEIVLNTTSATANSNFYNLQSLTCPEFFGEYSMYMRFRAKVTFGTNVVLELGQMRAPSSAAAPTDGVFFRVSATGTVTVVINFNGTETSSAASSGSLNTSNWYDFQIEVHSHYVKWNIVDMAGTVFFSDVVGGVANPLEIPVTQANPFTTTSSPHAPIMCRVRNSGVASPAGQIRLAAVTVSQRDMGQRRDWKENAALLGRGSYQGIAATSLASLAQTAQHANSTSPSDATLTNTAASYTTLGGRWQIAGRAGAATDFVLFGFQVPTGWKLVINSISISAMVLGANVATTPTVLDWSIAVGSSAVSLATTDGQLPNSWSPRRVPLGMQGWPIGALQGVAAQDIVRTFQTPLICDTISDAAGSFVHIILQVPAGTATASQKIRGDVYINAYWD